MSSIMGLDLDLLRTFQYAHPVTVLYSLFVIANANNRPCGPWVTGEMYHPRTETCIKLLRMKVRFYKAREQCRLAKGHLVKIDAGDIHNLVENMLQQYHTISGWIGLTYVNGKYRWDDFVNEEVTFFKFKIGPQKNELLPFSMMARGSWVEATGRNLSWPVCQFASQISPPKRSDSRSKTISLRPRPTALTPVTITPLPPEIPRYRPLRSPPKPPNPRLDPSGSRQQPIEMICPSKIKREGVFVIIQISYFSKGFDETRCYVNGNENLVASSPNIVKPYVPLSNAGFNIVMLRENVSAFSYESHSKRPPDGRWSCAIIKHKDDDKVDQQVIGSDFCEFLFFSPPKSLTFQYIHRPASNEVEVYCTAFQIYPKAFCEFTHRNGREDFHPLNDSQKVSYDHQSYTDPRVDNTYFKSLCSVVMAANAPPISRGNYTIRVKVYPDLKNITSSHLEFLTDELDIETDRDVKDDEDLLKRSPPQSSFRVWAICLGILLFHLVTCLAWQVVARVRRKKDAAKIGEEEMAGGEESTDDLLEEKSYDEHVEEDQQSTMIKLLHQILELDNSESENITKPHSITV